MSVTAPPAGGRTNEVAHASVDSNEAMGTPRGAAMTANYMPVSGEATSPDVDVHPSAEIERREQEGDSVNRAIAELLARGRSDLTQFEQVVGSAIFIRGAGADITVTTFQPRTQEADLGKAAVVFRITNNDPQVPWELDELRLFSATSKNTKPFAFSRAEARVVLPGQTETTAVVMDARAFGPDRNDHLVLEIWRRLTSGHPARQAAVELVMVDDVANAVKIPRGRRNMR